MVALVWGWGDMGVVLVDELNCCVDIDHNSASCPCLALRVEMAVRAQRGRVVVSNPTAFARESMHTVGPGRAFPIFDSDDHLAVEVRPPQAYETVLSADQKGHQVC